MLNSTLKDEPIQSPNAVMDERALGLLRFTAASAKLDVKLPDLAEDHPEDSTVCREWVPCCIRARSGKNVGYIWVPRPWLETHSHKQGEFILLSTHFERAESETCKYIPVEDPKHPDVIISDGIKHVDDCEHQSMYNVMLIDWNEGPHCTVATRVNITRIRKDD